MKTFQASLNSWRLRLMYTTNHLLESSSSIGMLCYWLSQGVLTDRIVVAIINTISSHLSTGLDLVLQGLPHSWHTLLSYSLFCVQWGNAQAPVMLVPELPKSSFWQIKSFHSSLSTNCASFLLSLHHGWWVVLHFKLWCAVLTATPDCASQGHVIFSTMPCNSPSSTVTKSLTYSSKSTWLHYLPSLVHIVAGTPLPSWTPPYGPTSSEPKNWC